jgi:hypothetical protein
MWSQYQPTRSAIPASIGACYVAALRKGSSGREHTARWLTKITKASFQSFCRVPFQMHQHSLFCEGNSAGLIFDHGSRVELERIQIQSIKGKRVSMLPPCRVTIGRHGSYGKLWKPATRNPRSCPCRWKSLPEFATDS